MSEAGTKSQRRSFRVPTIMIVGLIGAFVILMVMGLLGGGTPVTNFIAFVYLSLGLIGLGANFIFSRRDKR